MPKIEVDPDDLVTVAHVAVKVEMSRKTVQAWVRRYADFPAPKIATPYVRLWSWTEVAAWLTVNGLEVTP